MKPSRRRFLRSLLGAPLAARSGAAAFPAGPLAVIGGQEVFENPRFIRADAHCFTINDRDTFIFSGAFHYPRCPKLLWRDRLLKFQHAGFNTIETYVFWNYHEPSEGRADLSEFEEFIQLVSRMGFWMIARPGPYVCAEWERGGFPAWVAAKRFPLRSNHPESLRTSQHWYDQVLPVIRRHQVSVGGPIIMMQLENEYDFCRNIPEAEHKEYLRALAQMAWNAGISIPLITCWTRQARENADPVMARIMDTCNFYPRWNILPRVSADLKKLRQEEPNSPVAVTELQGGWFSQVGGKLSIDQDGIDGAQLDLLTKTVIEQGVTYFSYYMGFGGTNFDWAAKTMTTTYDYAAPIREPGGLWEKYYAARGICRFLRMFGGVLTRADLAEGVTQSTHPQISVSERVNGQSAVVFVRNNSKPDAGPANFKMTFRDPASPTHRPISVPREGELVLGPREMKMLAVQVPIAGGRLRYSTAEVLDHGLNLDRHFLIVYDQPGRLIEMALATDREPRIEGDAVYQYWDQEYETVVIGFRLDRAEKIFWVNDDLLVVAVPRSVALRTWVAEFPSGVIPGGEEPKPMGVPFLAESAFMAESGSRRTQVWAELDFRPGERTLTALLPSRPAKCRVAGVLTDLQYDRHWRTTRLPIRTPALPVRAFDVRDVRFWVERFDPAVGEWVTTQPPALHSPAGVGGRALEDLGPVPYGYVKYRAEFTYAGQPKLFLSTFTADEKKVFLNGKLAPEASAPKTRVELPLGDSARSGTNTLEISYEAFGSRNIGPEMGDLKGLESARLGADPQSATPIESWQFQRFPAAWKGREIDADFSVGDWKAGTLGEPSPKQDLVPAFTWCRADFSFERPSEGWWIPWKLTFDADRDALLYLNGKFVGRYATVGPQKDFYLPEPYLRPAQNTLTLVLAYADNPGHIRTLRVSPYEEFATYRTKIEFEF